MQKKETRQKVSPDGAVWERTLSDGTHMALMEKWKEQELSVQLRKFLPDVKNSEKELTNIRIPLLPVCGLAEQLTKDFRKVPVLAADEISEFLSEYLVLYHAREKLVHLLEENRKTDADSQICQLLSRLLSILPGLTEITAFAPEKILSYLINALVWHITWTKKESHME